MVDINKHKLFLFRILKDIYDDKELAGILGFKGGTALMFFYDLPRFSVDFDFNLLNPDKEEIVYGKIRALLLKHGNLHIEISKRTFNDRYEIKNLLGINMPVMIAPDMFAHKLCAMLDRSSITNRDIFDCWFFMNKKTSLNKSIVETRMEMTLSDYLQKCIDTLEGMSDKGILNGLGELMDENTKKFVRSKLRMEVISLLKFYKQFPILG